MSSGVRRSPKGLGRCTRWLRSLGYKCGRSARFEVHEGAQALCKECYARFKVGRETFFYAPPQERVWFCYVVRASDGSFYAGVTVDVDRRVAEHNLSPRGAKCLRGRRPVELVWRSAGMSKRAALRVEREVKRMRHAEKAALEVTWAASGQRRFHAALSALRRCEP